jgi:transcriptional regulatory protein LEU3
MPALEILAHVSSPRTSYSIFQNRRSIGGGSSVPEQVPTPSQTTTYTTPTAHSVRRSSEPRALGSRVFSGEDIDYYFDK